MRNVAAIRHMQHVVIEAIFFIPHACAVGAEMVDRVGDVEEVLPEFAGHVFVGRIFAGQLHRDSEQVQAVHGHPTGAVGLLDVAASGKRRAAVEDADVVESEKSALKHIAALGVLAVHPPGEVQQQLVENALQESAIAHAAALLLDLVDAQRRPGVHRRIDVAERPLVGRHLPVGMHVPFAQHQHELLLGEFGIDQRERHACETPDPRRRTRDIPTCPAWRSRRRYRDATIRGCGRFRVRREAAGKPGSPFSQSLTT